MTAISKQDAVRERAHQLWIVRGRPSGSPLQDWLQAEREIGASAPGSSNDALVPSIKVPNPPESEVDVVMRETPKVGSRDAPGG